ncbi:hypothetical protein HPB48_006256 [Haemaphysalis longicornis]|uniref:Uncharacterized protein n=1 Tax=Haemaphysalis longicornis TaxID=44386 RepID=A0A9J6GQ38_HAELO|nr:hypothetical protein HPB48_006256 [Haemaphysalis longicornis]
MAATRTKSARMRPAKFLSDEEIQELLFQSDVDLSDEDDDLDDLDDRTSLPGAHWTPHHHKYTQSRLCLRLPTSPSTFPKPFGSYARRKQTSIRFRRVPTDLCARPHQR